MMIGMNPQNPKKEETPLNYRLAWLLLYCFSNNGNCQIISGDFKRLPNPDDRIKRSSNEINNK